MHRNFFYSSVIEFLKSGRAYYLNTFQNNNSVLKTICRQIVNNMEAIHFTPKMFFPSCSGNLGKWFWNDRLLSSKQVKKKLKEKKIQTYFSANGYIRCLVAISLFYFFPIRSGRATNFDHHFAKRTRCGQIMSIKKLRQTRFPLSADGSFKSKKT